MRILSLALTASLALCTIQAQIAPTNDELIDHWKLSKEFTLAVADAMPVEQYGFKVDQGEMSFAALMIHIAGSQAFRLAQVAGVDFPLVGAAKRNSPARYVETVPSAFLDIEIAGTCALAAEAAARIQSTEESLPSRGPVAKSTGFVFADPV